MVAEKGAGLLYEDKYIAVLLHRLPSTSGHILLLPKEHYPIFEQVPDYVVAKLFVLANKISTMLFETLNIQGTNVLVSNGIEAGQEAPHAMLNVLGRVEGDGLSMQWQPKQMSEEEMGTIELMLKEECKGIGEFEKEPSEPLNLDAQKKEEGKEKGAHHGESYMLKHIRRVP
jgi:diadenosine tetraphosphate (Ap4A) HIT family hydrolase